MVEWYEPLSLLKTAKDVVVSSLFGQYADPRVRQSIRPPNPLFIDLSAQDQGEEYWFDFVADTGDGFNSTYDIARNIAIGDLNLPIGEDGKDSRIPVKAGKLLVFGGDLVYPVAHFREYTDRFYNPWSAAYNGVPQNGHNILAIPGNHDWYDNLQLFSRLFIREERLFNSDIPQEHSYFAAKLPGDWWVFGLDLQLHSSIDFPQYSYFCSVYDDAAFNCEKDRIILICPEPFWLKQRESELSNSPFADTQLDRLVKKLDANIRLMVAGDLHHYMRFESEKKDGRHRITCGGGGAFLHPTHLRSQTKPIDGFCPITKYPTAEVSKALARRNGQFIWYNRSFGTVTAFFYLLIAWFMGRNMGLQFPMAEFPEPLNIRELGKLSPFQLSDWPIALLSAFQSLMLSPNGSLCVILMVMGFWLFTDRESKKFQYMMGSLHGLAHLFAAFVSYWIASYIAIDLLELTPKHWLQFITSACIIAFLGWLVGSCLLGLYLWLSVRFFDKHANEAFSSLKIEDWKCYLKFRIHHNTLTVFPVGIRRVPRAWKASRLASGPIFEPNDSNATSPHLIEAPFDVQ